MGSADPGAVHSPLRGDGTASDNSFELSPDDGVSSPSEERNPTRYRITLNFFVELVLATVKLVLNLHRGIGGQRVHQHIEPDQHLVIVGRVKSPRAGSKCRWFRWWVGVLIDMDAFAWVGNQPLGVLHSEGAGIRWRSQSLLGNDTKYAMDQLGDTLPAEAV
jgi:hypothetical protein